MCEQRVNRRSAAPGSVLRGIGGGFTLDVVPGLSSMNTESVWVDGHDLALVLAWDDYTNYVLVLYAGRVGWAATWLWEAAW